MNHQFQHGWLPCISGIWAVLLPHGKMCRWASRSKPLREILLHREAPNLLRAAASALPLISLLFHLWPTNLAYSLRTPGSGETWSWWQFWKWISSLHAVFLFSAFVRQSQGPISSYSFSWVCHLVLPHLSQLLRHDGPCWELGGNTCSCISCHCFWLYLYLFLVVLTHENMRCCLGMPPPHQATRERRPT